jgi:hypothetical protein
MKNATTTKVPARLVSSKKFKAANTVAKVWMICNALRTKARKEVIAACVAQKINFHTARTQYQQWFVEATSN